MIRARQVGILLASLAITVGLSVASAPEAAASEMRVYNQGSYTVFVRDSCGGSRPIYVGRSVNLACGSRQVRVPHTIHGSGIGYCSVKVYAPPFYQRTFTSSTSDYWASFPYGSSGRITQTCRYIS